MTNRSDMVDYGMNYSCSTLSCTALAAPAHAFNIVPHTTTSLITFSVFHVASDKYCQMICYYITPFTIFFSASSISFFADPHPVPKTMTCTFFKFLLQQHPLLGTHFYQLFCSEYATTNISVAYKNKHVFLT